VRGWWEDRKHSGQGRQMWLGSEVGIRAGMTEPIVNTGVANVPESMPSAERARIDVRVCFIFVSASEGGIQ